MQRTKNEVNRKKYYTVAIMDGETTVFSIRQKVNKDIRKILNSEGEDSVRSFLMQSICLCWVRIHGEESIKPGFHVSIDGVVFTFIDDEYLDALKKSIVKEFEIRKFGEGMQGATDFKRVTHDLLMNEEQINTFMSLSPKYQLEILSLFKKSSRKVLLEGAKKRWNLDEFTKMQLQEHTKFLRDFKLIDTNPEKNPSLQELNCYLFPAAMLTHWDNWDVYTFDRLKDMSEAGALEGMMHFENILRNEFDEVPEIYHTRLQLVKDAFASKLKLV